MVRKKEFGWLRHKKRVIAMLFAVLIVTTSIPTMSTYAACTHPHMNKMFAGDRVTVTWTHQYSIIIFEEYIYDCEVQEIHHQYYLDCVDCNYAVALPDVVELDHSGSPYCPGYAFYVR
jgi:hypothetical protein